MEECVSVLLTDMCELHLPELRGLSEGICFFSVLSHCATSGIVFNVGFSCVGINRSSTSRQAQTNHVCMYSMHTFDMVSMATLMGKILLFLVLYSSVLGSLLSSVIRGHCCLDFFSSHTQVTLWHGYSCKIFIPFSILSIVTQERGHDSCWSTNLLIKNNAWLISDVQFRICFTIIIISPLHDYCGCNPD